MGAAQTRVVFETSEDIRRLEERIRVQKELLRSATREDQKKAINAEIKRAEAELSKLN